MPHSLINISNTWSNVMLNKDRAMINQTAKKLKAIEILGCNCKHCGCNMLDNHWYAEFHHINPLTKDKNVTDLMSSNWMYIEKELQKCILLCSNCHRKQHYNEERFIKYKDEIYKLKEKVQEWTSQKNKLTNEDTELINNLHKKGKTIFFISKQLHVTRKVIRRYYKLNNMTPNITKDEIFKIPKEKLIEMVNSGMSIGRIAKIYKTTFTTIKRKLIKYKIPYTSTSKFCSNNKKIILDGS